MSPDQKVWLSWPQITLSCAWLRAIVAYPLLYLTPFGHSAGSQQLFEIERSVRCGRNSRRSPCEGTWLIWQSTSSSARRSERSSPRSSSTSSCRSLVRSLADWISRTTTRRYPPKWKLADADAKKQGAVLGWGQFLTVVINFLIIAWVLFIAIKGMNRLNREEAAGPPPGPTAEVKLLTEIRDLLKK